MSGLTWVLLLPAVGSLVVVVVGWNSGSAGPNTPLGPAGWSFSDSWASNLTAVLAIFGALFGADLLSEGATSISKDGYTIASVLFGIALLLGPLVYIALASPKKSQTGDIQYQGYVGAYALAAFVVLWAVFGQLMLTLVLTTDIKPVHDGIDLLITVAAALALSAALLQGWKSTAFVFRELPESEATEAAFRWTMP